MSSSESEKRRLSEASYMSDEAFEGIAHKRSRSRPVLQDTIETLGVLDPALDQETGEMVITRIRATDVALGLGRLPAGFYVAVRHSGLAWETENMPSSVKDDIVEWSGPIPIPSVRSATVHLEVYASFEFQPMLGVGEQLRTLTVTVDTLLDHGAGDVPVGSFPKIGDVISPCSSISVTVKQWGDSSTSMILRPHCSTVEPCSQLEDATNRGHSALSRHRKHGERRDLDHSVEMFERALDICPPDHLGRGAALSNLATATFSLCKVEGADPGLPIRLYRDVLGMRPVGHPDRPATLIQLATMHLEQFKKSKDDSDGERAQTLLQEAIELSPTEGHQHRAAMRKLQQHIRRRGAFTVQLLQRFDDDGDIADVERAITVLKDLARFPADVWDGHFHAVLGNLCAALSHRFECLGDLGDLEETISIQKDAVRLTPDGHPDKHGHLNNLSHYFIVRFDRLGDLGDLDAAISAQRDAIQLIPGDDPDKFGYLHDLAIHLKTRFKRLGELGNLDDAISIQKEVVQLTPDGDPDKPGRLIALGVSFMTRFERVGGLKDLEDAISTQRLAVRLTRNKHDSFTELGNALIARFKRLGELNDLEDAISTYKDAVRLIPEGHSDKPACLTNLGNSLNSRFERHGELRDLEDAILTQRAAVQLIPSDHSDRPTCLNNLGVSLITRFERLGELSDLEDAIASLAFIARFQRIGEISDLEDAISTRKDAVHLVPHGHPDKPGCLNNLGDAFRTRFERLGELGDLEDAISTLKDAVWLTPHDHPEKPGYLSNLGVSFRTRFDHLGELSDLEDAISTLKDAVQLIPDGHADKPGILNNIGISMIARFERYGELGDLEGAISTQKLAILLIPDDHVDKPIYLNNLGNAFRVRFERLGKLTDLEEAIVTQKAAVQLTPHGQFDRPACLNNLANSFSARFESLGEVRDLENAISTQRDALQLTPRGYPDQAGYLITLGNYFYARFELLEEAGDAEIATSLYVYAASSPLGPIDVRFRASQQWISSARRMAHYSLLHAYSIAIHLLPQLAWIGLPLSQRYSQLTLAADVVREAGAAALDAGFPEVAVEWLEQGRSIVWGELFQLRSSFKELSSAHPDHARKLEKIFSALEHASATREQILSAISDRIGGAAHGMPESLRVQVDKHRRLAIDRDKLLEEIRRLPGFEQFLRQKELSQLGASAHSGPVLILNAADSRCDALIVLSNVNHAIHVPLPNFTLKQSIGLQNTLKSVVRHARDAQRVTEDGFSWESILSPLWKCVVKPILDALAFSSPGDPSRIFWCPTGPFAFLPIHAAGFYDGQYSEPGHKVFDFVVSSYVPTLSVLSPSPNLGLEPDSLRLLLVPQPDSDGLSRLGGAVTELEHIREVVGHLPSSCTTLVESSFGTVEEVLSLMKEVDWVHFACHGVQDATDRTNTGLCLADRRRLKLRDILALSRSHGGLAFLSACQTAMGDERLADEAIHISAGMLFAGYGGIIGTMWAISDSLAPIVAKEVYHHLFQDGERLLARYMKPWHTFERAAVRRLTSGFRSFMLASEV